jgi:hypothetical protein
MSLNLGVVYKDGNLVNHRSLLKVAINPVLRIFGIQISTWCDMRTRKLYWVPRLVRFTQRKEPGALRPLEWREYEIREADGYRLEKRRTIV